MQKAKTIGTLAALVCAAALCACDPSQTSTADEPGPTTAAGPGDAATPPYIGTWATDEAACAIPQDQEGAPHIFGVDTYDQHETHCTYANVAQTGENSWRIDAACQSSGDEASLRWDLTVNGDALSIDGSRLLVRCRS